MFTCTLHVYRIMSYIPMKGGGEDGPGGGGGGVLEFIYGRDVRSGDLNNGA